MARKPYSPVASYSDLSTLETRLQTATEIGQIQELVRKDGPKVGYKAFCYLLGGRMTAAAMKPDEACTHALTLEQAGKNEEALAIYQAVLAVHSDHPLAKEKAAQLSA